MPFGPSRPQPLRRAFAPSIVSRRAARGPDAGPEKGRAGNPLTTPPPAGRKSSGEGVQTLGPSGTDFLASLSPVNGKISSKTPLTIVVSVTAGPRTSTQTSQCIRGVERGPRHQASEGEVTGPPDSGGAGRHRRGKGSQPRRRRAFTSVGLAHRDFGGKCLRLGTEDTYLPPPRAGSQGLPDTPRGPLSSFPSPHRHRSFADSEERAGRLLPRPRAARLGRRGARQGAGAAPQAGRRGAVVGRPTGAVSCHAVRRRRRGAEGV